MEEMVLVLKLARGMVEKREDVEKENAGGEIRMKKKGAEEESRVEGEKRVKLERRERKGNRKMEESTIGSGKRQR